MTIPTTSMQSTHAGPLHGQPGNPGVAPRIPERIVVDVTSPPVQRTVTKPWRARVSLLGVTDLKSKYLDLHFDRAVRLRRLSVDRASGEIRQIGPGKNLEDVIGPSEVAGRDYVYVAQNYPKLGWVLFYLPITVRVTNGRYLKALRDALRHRDLHLMGVSLYRDVQ
jgi:hypothetical protein